MEPRCYTIHEVIARLKMSRSTFDTLHAAGRLPFIEEIRPRLGRTIRYRADLVDRYLAGQWPAQARAHLAAARKRA